MERRCLLHPKEPRIPRLSDLEAIVPAVTGQIEPVYEGEQEDPVLVANKLTGRAILKTFQRHFPPIYTKEDAQHRGKLAPAERALTMEWVLAALHPVSLIAKQSVDGGRTRFTGMLANMFSGGM